MSRQISWLLSFIVLVFGMSAPVQMVLAATLTITPSTITPSTSKIDIVAEVENCLDCNSMNFVWVDEQGFPYSGVVITIGPGPSYIATLRPSEAAKSHLINREPGNHTIGLCRLDQPWSQCSSIGATATYTVVPDPIPGDVNGDNSANALDVVAVVNAVLGLSSLPTADVNNDGSINALDVVFVINRVLGIPPT